MEVNTTSAMQRPYEGNCKEHGKYSGNEYTLDGSTWHSPPCPLCSSRAQLEKENERKAKEKNDHETRVRRRLEMSGIPKRYQGMVYADYQTASEGHAKALDAIKKYSGDLTANLEKSRCMVLCGNTGTGKTMLSCFLVRDTIYKGRSARYTKALDMLSDVKSSWKLGEEKRSDVRGMYTGPDLLVLDEVGMHYSREADEVIMYDILSTRHDAMKPTIIVSNLDIVSLKEVLGIRLYDRLRENGGVMVQFDWESWRGKKT